MTEQKPCDCSAAPTLIFACSGAADVGEATDVAARKLAREGVGKMFCLAGVGGRVSAIMETTKAAGHILALDGCPLDCARHTLQEAEITEFTHMRVTDLGIEKGKITAMPDAAATIAGKARAILSGDKGSK